jgi:hypothetical protein
MANRAPPSTCRRPAWWFPAAVFLAVAALTAGDVRKHWKEYREHRRYQAYMRRAEQREEERGHAEAALLLEMIESQARVEAERRAETDGTEGWRQQPVCSIYLETYLPGGHALRSTTCFGVVLPQRFIAFPIEALRLVGADPPAGAPALIYVEVRARDEAGSYGRRADSLRRTCVISATDADLGVALLRTRSQLRTPADLTAQDPIEGRQRVSLSRIHDSTRVTDMLVRAAGKRFSLEDAYRPEVRPKIGTALIESGKLLAIVVRSDETAVECAPASAIRALMERAAREEKERAAAEGE